MEPPEDLRGSVRRVRCSAEWLSPPRKSKCASASTRQDSDQRGSPSRCCFRTRVTIKAAGHQPPGSMLGYQSRYSAFRDASRGDMQTLFPN